MKAKHWIFSCALFIAAALFAAGCAGGNKPEASAPPSSSAASKADGDVKKITIEATNFDFDQREIRLKKGESVQFEIVNKQGLHAIKIDGFDKEIRAGQPAVYTADETGEFRYYCSIMCGAGHADMIGKIIVE